MILSTGSGRAADAAIAQCSTSAILDVKVFRADGGGRVVAAVDVEVIATAPGELEGRPRTSAQGYAYIRLTQMDGDAEVRLRAGDQDVRVTLARNTAGERSLFIGGPFLVWSFTDVRQRPGAVALRAADSAERLGLELLGDAAALEVEITDGADRAEVRDRLNAVVAVTQREEHSLDMFGEDEVTHKSVIEVAASRLPLSLPPPSRLHMVAAIKGKDGSAVTVDVYTPQLGLQQRRSRVTNTGSVLETVTQVVYSADTDVELEVNDVPGGGMSYAWTLAGVVNPSQAVSLRHRFAVVDGAAQARADAAVRVVATHAASGFAVTLNAALRLALPSYHGDLPAITDDYLENTFHWTAAAPVVFDALESDPALVTIWTDRIGVAPSLAYRLRAGAPPAVEGGAGVTALAAIPYNPVARGATRRIFGGVVNTNLRAKGLTVAELTAIVGHEAVHLAQHAAARDDGASMWRALDDLNVDAYSLREIEAHVWEMARPGLSHKHLQATVDFFVDFYRLAVALHGGLDAGALKDRVRDFINAQHDAIPDDCAVLKRGGALAGLVRRIA